VIEKSIKDNSTNVFHRNSDSFIDYDMVTESTWTRIKAIHAQAFESIVPVLRLRLSPYPSREHWVNPPPSHEMNAALDAKERVDEEIRIKAEAEAAQNITLHGDDGKRSNGSRQSDEKKKREVAPPTAHELAAGQLTQLSQVNHRTVQFAEDITRSCYAPFSTRMIWPNGISSTRARNNTWYRFPSHWTEHDICSPIEIPSIRLLVGHRLSSALNCSLEDVIMRVLKSNDKDIKSLEHLLHREIHVTHEIGGMVFMSLETASEDYFSNDIRLCMLWSPRREGSTEDGRTNNDNHDNNAELCGTLLWKRLYRCNAVEIRIIEDCTSFMYIGTLESTEAHLPSITNIIRLTDGECIAPLIQLPTIENPPGAPCFTGRSSESGLIDPVGCDVHCSFDGRFIAFRVGHRIDIYNVMDILQVASPFPQVLGRPIEPVHQIEFKLPTSPTFHTICVKWLCSSNGDAFLVSVLPSAFPQHSTVYLCGDNGEVVRYVDLQIAIPV
jgi:hypothetical protein